MAGFRSGFTGIGIGKRVLEMAEREEELRVFMVAGELSGDAIASRLMSALRRLSPLPLRFAGVGGPSMQNEGLHSRFPMDELSVMGIWELLPHLSKFRVHLKETTEAAFHFRPHAVVTVDSKGFSFRFLKLLRAKFTSVESVSPVIIHYVAPSFWGWKGGDSSLSGLSRFIDHVLCILPFEAHTCRVNGLNATFVGHPVIEDALSSFRVDTPDSNNLRMVGDGALFRQVHEIPPEATVLSVLPGSREQEVTRLFPIYMRSLELLSDSFPELTAVIPVVENEKVKDYITRTAPACRVRNILIPGGSLTAKYNAFSASAAALCTSGTSVMELQLARLPCVVGYRAHALTEFIIKLRTTMNFISLPNILLNKAMIPEVLFASCTPENVAARLRQVIRDQTLRQQQFDCAEKVLSLLCPSKECPSLQPFEEFLSNSSDCLPSTIAAAAVLCSRRNL